MVILAVDLGYHGWSKRSRKCPLISIWTRPCWFHSKGQEHTCLWGLSVLRKLNISFLSFRPGGDHLVGWLGSNNTTQFEKLVLKKKKSANSSASDTCKRKFGDLIEKEELVSDKFINKNYLHYRCAWIVLEMLWNQCWFLLKLMKADSTWLYLNGFVWLS